MNPTVAVVHDYLTQRGGAERVLLRMLEAWPDATLHTALYQPETTYPEFGAFDVRTMALNRVAPLRRDHRRALFLLAAQFSRYRVEGDVVVVSSSGWAHGVQALGPKVVYCHTPARWLYDPERYLASGLSLARPALSVARPYLLDWDRRAARSAVRYVANSTVVQRRIQRAYGVDAEVLPPPHGIEPGERRAIPGLEPGFHLLVSRLLPYKNVDAVLAAFARMPHDRLVVVGTGPERSSLEASAPANVRFLGTVTDEELRWLYDSAVALVSASYEDYGLTPLEAAAFGKPAVVPRAGGFLDTVDEGVSGLFFDRPDPATIAAALAEMRTTRWDEGRIREHAERFSRARFIRRLREIVDDVARERVAA